MRLSLASILFGVPPASRYLSLKDQSVVDLMAEPFLQKEMEVGKARAFMTTNLEPKAAALRHLPTLCAEARNVSI